MNKSKHYLNEINHLKQKLNPIDLKYFDDLQVYMTTKNLFFNEEVIYSQLLSMIQDLLDANEDNINAESFFGNNPKTMAHEILSELPHPRLRDQGSFISLIIGISWFCLLLSGQNDSHGMQLNSLAFILVPLIEIGMTFLFIKLLHYSVYQRHQSIFYLLSGLLFVIGTLLIVIIVRVPSMGFSILIPSPWNIYILSIIVIISIIYLIYSIRTHKNNTQS
ncbi:hypothetical protein [Companilactobacillus nuruki]|uniref:DUF1129 domain-containing protein n=1 Tax=Companilactobacillus nuruki TaxID=1993540 RepID=A0A2N7ATN2_9LACO|nr:hypothetical protein [Companilactobacillus nuruki]PMD69824.1 hypothetical protein CBP76_07875 [Companilactobacillus nuruki]